MAGDSELVRRAHAQEVRQLAAACGDGGSMRTDHPIFKVIGTCVCTIKYPDFNMLATNVNFDHKHSLSLHLWVCQ